MTEMKRIVHREQVLAIILPASYRPEGIEFVTEPESTMQLAAMRHKAGHLIKPHAHNPVSRNILYTQEALIVRSGKVRADLYSPEQEYVESHVLGPGDVILLIAGGHGFEVLEDLDMVEIKQGPFIGEADKTRFAGRPPSRIQP